MTVFQKHQRKIAIDTLKMSDAGALIMGGMTKQQAREFLQGDGWTKRRIAKLEGIDLPPRPDNTEFISIP